MRFRMNFGNQIILAILVTIAISVVTYKSAIFPDNPDKYLTVNFPLVEQPDQITCGPTSALMLLKYYGDDKVTLDEVKSHSKTHWFDYGEQPIGMTAPDVLANALKKLGLPCKMMEGDENKLRHFVSEGRPTIVLVRSGEYTWHYVVVIGYDENGFTVADPGWGQAYYMKMDAFHGSWSFKTDMAGKIATDKIVVGVLSLAEVNPFTMIVPNNSKD